MNTLIVTVNKQLDGYNFSLMPKVRKELAQAFPGSFQVEHIFIAFDKKADFEEMYGHVEKHLLPFLTGVDMETLSQKIQQIKFVDPYQKTPIYTLNLSDVQETEFIPG